MRKSLKIAESSITVIYGMIAHMRYVYMYVHSVTFLFYI